MASMVVESVAAAEPVVDATTQVKIVIVEGNISAGKSTLCRTLSEKLGYVLYLEPTVENPFLEKFYGNPKKYALPMQLWLLKQRFVTYLKAIRYCMTNNGETHGVILDRSIWSDVVFAEKNFFDGNISKQGYAYYNELREQMLRCLPLPHALVYLDASPQVCYDRIHSLRKRECEDGIPLAYLQGLDTCYKNFVASMEKTASVVKCVEWNTFKGDAAIIDFITSTPTPALHSWADSHHELVELVQNPDMVTKLMTMSYTIDEATGADVDVADPDFITMKEVRVMPVLSSSRRVAAMKRPVPDHVDDADDAELEPQGHKTRTAAGAIAVMSPTPSTDKVARKASPTSVTELMMA